MSDITVEAKKELIEGKLRLWRNTLYSVELDAKTAQKFSELKIEGGDAMLKQSEAEMKKCFSAIEFLLSELKALG